MTFCKATAAVGRTNIISRQGQDKLALVKSTWRSDSPYVRLITTSALSSSTHETLWRCLVTLENVLVTGLSRAMGTNWNPEGLLGSFYSDMSPFALQAPLPRPPVKNASPLPLRRHLFHFVGAHDLVIQRARKCDGHWQLPKLQKSNPHSTMWGET